MATLPLPAAPDAYGPGFLGKMPAVGDFVRAGLPRGVADRWDALLIDTVELARRRHGRAWAEVLAGAPVWRFACAPGLSGADAVVGVLVPSGDRVGRPYPLMIAATLPPGSGIALAPFACDPWFAGVEGMLPGVRAARLDREGLAAGLGGVGRPIPDPGFLEPLCRRLIEDRIGRLPEPASLWWTLDPAPGRSALFACAGLPGAVGLSSLFDDGWRTWSAAQGASP